MGETLRPMAARVVLAGVGGQGVVYATRVLARAAVLGGLPVMAAENHGMSQRGGSVQAHLHIGGTQAPLVRRGTAHALIAFDRQEALRNLAYLRPGGSLVMNSASGLGAPLASRLAELGMMVCWLDAGSRAQALGTPGAANLVLLGFAAAQAGLGLGLALLKDAVQALGPTWAVEANWSALDAGAAEHAAV
jgi:indolepyruvate ferredoxin oxidoreductase, beta subunit